MLCVVMGCHSGGNVVGKWTGSVVVDSGYENDMGAKMAEGFAKAISFELKADKTFSGTLLFPVEGTYTVDGNKVTLAVTKVMGMDGKGSTKSDKPMVFEVAADGKTMNAPDLSKGSGKDAHYKLVLKKE